MRKLKIILQYKYFFIILVILTLIIDFLFLNLYSFKSKYDKDTKEFIGIVTKYELKENRLVLEIKSSEK